MIDFKPFLGEKTTRRDMSLPRIQRGLLVACDGRLAIALQEFDYSGPFPEDMDKPDVIGVLSPCETLAEWRDMPHVDQCDKCGNTGYLPLTKVCCGECRGEGEVTCNYDHDHECPDCEGSGKVDETPECECRKLKVKFGAKDCAKHYSARFAKLPNVQWSAMDFDNNGTGDTAEIAVFFKFDGGFGALMPLSPN